MSATELPPGWISCRHLLDVELSSFQCFREALQRHHEQPVRAVLREVGKKHRQNIASLLAYLSRFGCRIEEEPMDDLAEPCVVDDLGKLEQREAATWREYRDALADPGLPERLRKEIRSRLIPRLEANIGDFSRARLSQHLREIHQETTHDAA
ncbi:hypothetical protein [Luteolibacter marinus]|uniref:hypothetical protein n=1 Tax=Luteolibacter marinus TaxID=2776705 RepID=UPI001868F4ED|nr:hypothetical protein [Luteolibacter marinus]